MSETPNTITRSESTARVLKTKENNTDKNSSNNSVMLIQRSKMAHLWQGSPGYLDLSFPGHCSGLSYAQSHNPSQASHASVFFIAANNLFNFTKISGHSTPSANSMGVGSYTNIPKFGLSIFREILEKSSKYLQKFSKSLQKFSTYPENFKF